MSETSDCGLLLRRIAYGDTSLIVHLLTEKHGRIALMARGARRQKSPFRAELEPLHLLSLQWKPGRSGMGTLVNIGRGKNLLDESKVMSGLELMALAAVLFPEGSPHGYRESLEAFHLLSERSEAVGPAAAAWHLLRDGGWVGDMQQCWHCGRDIEKESMFWKQAELHCGCSQGGVEISAGLRKAIDAVCASANISMAEPDLRLWYSMIQDVLRQHDVRARINKPQGE